jgi:hypothetical protein
MGILEPYFSGYVVKFYFLPVQRTGNFPSLYLIIKENCFRGFVRLVWFGSSILLLYRSLEKRCPSVAVNNLVSTRPWSGVLSYPKALIMKDSIYRMCSAVRDRID